MAYYKYQGAYTAEAWRALLKKPANRAELIRPVIERLGGSVENWWFTFGEHDFVVIAQMPDNVSAAAFSLAAAAGGSVKTFVTTPLITMPEGIAAMKKAAKSGYRPPAK
jgi:uncharacterized protein with GYD domain